ncbi:hypothetical protein GYMLUDRAFT_78573 [Collybiopsis luxurians FD-317 M1]|uniref:Unplaced genomic scaffold GYMLUscaffold_182, whole genome shotgun sequence n=1 Tax=Collybiopsis luxurians FD-317 M1 TaxID=944289 RepID=A0A0D0BKZ3_9AGAR|nr:hypothetical protein GYMLUDRAFT_78573 [Collybiopsis luxurians FD-317 M1]
MMIEVSSLIMMLSTVMPVILFQLVLAAVGKQDCLRSLQSFCLVYAPRLAFHVCLKFLEKLGTPLEYQL